MRTSPFQSKKAHDPEENPQLTWGTFSFSPTFPGACRLPLKATKAFGVRRDAETPCGGKNNTTRISSNSLISFKSQNWIRKSASWGHREIVPQLLFRYFPLSSSPFLSGIFCSVYLHCHKEFTSYSVWYNNNSWIRAGAIGGMAMETLHFWKIASCTFSLPIRLKKKLYGKQSVCFVNCWWWFFTPSIICILSWSKILYMKAVSEPPIHCSGCSRMKAINNHHQWKSILVSGVLQVLELAYN